MHTDTIKTNILNDFKAFINSILSVIETAQQAYFTIW